MNLSNELISQFVKVTNDNPKTQSESTVYGTTVEYDGKIYVRIDGSDRLTPISTTTDMKADERVTVSIKNHTATVTGNFTAPAARVPDVEAANNKISEFGTVIAEQIVTTDFEAINAYIESLKTAILNTESLTAEQIEAALAEIDEIYAKYADLEYLTANDIEAINAEFENLEATFGKFENISAEDLEAVNAEITYLTAYTANLTYLSAVKAEVKELDAKMITTDQLEAKYANIDFANITEAAVKKIFSDYGVIDEIIASDGTITKQLVAVEINGDLIKAGTIQVDRLIIRGSDGNLYEINTNFDALEGVTPVEEDTIHGSILVAESVTAEKIRVDDLLAFKATIAGFNIKEITDSEGNLITKAIYSGVKSSVDNTTDGVYMDRDGQFAVGGQNDYLMFYKDENGDYHLAVRASTIKLGSSGKSVEEVIDEATDITVGARNLIRNSKNLLFDNYHFTSATASES